MRYMVGESEVLMCSSRDRETTEVFFMSLTDSQNLQDTHTHTHTHRTRIIFISQQTTTEDSAKFTRH